MTVTILTGDCRDVLRTLPDRSMHCCVTSPPYFGLRDYGTATWTGGDAECLHKGAALQSPSSTLSGNGHGGDKPLSPYLQSQGIPFKKVCGLCGALRSDNQMGLEPTPDAFVAQLVAVFREVRRVLRDDGTLWLNLGDSYAGSGRGGNPDGGTKQGTNKGSQSIGILYGLDQTGAAAERARMKEQFAALKIGGLKPKDLIGIPWMVAFAMRADGWYLRQDIIWSKPNPMPESVKDRCTKAHEYIFMLSKSRVYHYDAAAIAEPAIYSGLANQDASGFKDPRSFAGKHKNGYRSSGKQRGHSRRHTGFNDRWDAMEKAEQCSGSRNKRSVWTVAPRPYKEAHFATFPPALIEPCILAGCPIGGTVLDPFGGAGTTAMVAQQHGRHAILIELNPDYAAMAQRRVGVSEPAPPVPPRQRRPWRIDSPTT